MTHIPPQYANQKVGVQGYRVLNLDLDGVCADYSGGLRDYLIRHGLMSESVYPSEENYYLTDNEGWPFETADDYIKIHKAAALEHLYAHMKPLPGVSRALHILAKNHVYIRIVTHRLFVSGQHQVVVADTAQWLEDNDIPYMSLCFAGLKDSIQATIHIDDSPDNISVLRQARQHVVVFDHAYNRSLPGPRISQWDDATTTQLLEWFDHWPQAEE